MGSGCVGSAQLLHASHVSLIADLGALLALALAHGMIVQERSRFCKVFRNCLDHSTPLGVIPFPTPQGWAFGIFWSGLRRAAAHRLGSLTHENARLVDPDSLTLGLTVVPNGESTVLTLAEVEGGGSSDLDLEPVVTNNGDGLGCGGVDDLHWTNLVCESFGAVPLQQEKDITDSPGRTTTFVNV